MRIKLTIEKLWKKLKEIEKLIDIDPYLIYAIVETESSRIINAESASGAYGLMQLKEIVVDDVNQFFKLHYSHDDIKEWDRNLEIGAFYLKRWLSYYGRFYSPEISLQLALLTYCFGYTNVQKWLNNEPDNLYAGDLPPDKIEYSEKVLFWYVYGKSHIGLN